MCQCELIGTHGRAIEWAYPRPHFTPNPSNWGRGVEKSLFKLQPNGRRSTKRSTKMLMGHIFEHIGWLWSDAMNNHRAFAKGPNKWTQILSAQYKRSSSFLITIVVMTLYYELTFIKYKTVFFSWWEDLLSMWQTIYHFARWDNANHWRLCLSLGKSLEKEKSVSLNDTLGLTEYL